MKSRSILVLIVCYLIASPVYADLADAREARKRGDLKAAAQEYRRLAEQGDALAQAHLGYMYYAGEGVVQNHTKAFEWYKKAADQGNPDAQYNLAVAFAFGEGVPQDYRRAVTWYRRAAEQDHALAQYSLGLSYAQGEGVEQDYDQALLWYQKAADQGYAAARNDRDRLERALAEAERTEAAASAGAASKPLTGYGAARGEGDILALDGLEPTLFGKQHLPGGNLLGMPATTGTPINMLVRDAGEAPGQDRGTTGDTGTVGPTEAAETTAPAPGGGAGEDAKPAGARDHGRRLYEQGMQALADGRYAAAVNSLRESARRGDPRAQYRLGSLYYQGLGVAQDYTKAMDWYRQAAQDGHVDAQYSLGNMYFMGEGVERDDRRAADWYQEAAEQGHAPARHNLSNLERLMQYVETR